MSIQFTAVKCPACGANLQMEEGRKEIFCAYCGTKIIVTDDAASPLSHEEELKKEQAETDRMVRMKKLEMLEKKRASQEKEQKLKILLSVILGVIGFLSLALQFVLDTDSGAGFLIGMVALTVLIYIWLLSPKREDDLEVQLGEKVRVPKDIIDYERKEYGAIESMFLKAGFTNVRSVPMHDLHLGILKKPGTVKSITINGETITTGGRKFYPGAVVVISYHSLA